eukprot:354251_1
MCWSWEVSLVFALLQWIIIAYLLYRNKFWDRLCAILQSFIAIQETFQFLLWAFAIDENTTATTCSAFNTFCSYGLLFDVTSVLTGYGVVCAYASSYIDKSSSQSWRFKGLVTYTFIAIIFELIYIIAAFYYDVHRDDIHCTYVGENGHQVWAYMDIKDLHAAIATARKLMWIFLIVAVCFVRPCWPFLPCALYGALTLVISNVAVQFSQEWASLWCWANFAEGIW